MASKLFGKNCPECGCYISTLLDDCPACGGLKKTLHPTYSSDNAWSCGDSASMAHTHGNYASAANTHVNYADSIANTIESLNELKTYYTKALKKDRDELAALKRKSEPRHKFIGTCSYIELHEKVGKPGEVYFTTDTQELYGWINEMWTLMCNHTSIQSVVERAEVPSLLGRDMYITKAKTIVAHNQAGEVMYSFSV